jgi:hypothetical protein
MTKTIELQTIDSLDTAVFYGAAVATMCLLGYLGHKLRELYKKKKKKGEDDDLPPQGGQDPVVEPLPPVEVPSPIFIPSPSPPPPPFPSFPFKGGDGEPDPI